MLKFSLIIPMYNEAETIPYTCPRLKTVGQKILNDFSFDQIEFIFVNDGSHDSSYDLLSQEKLKIESDPRFKSLILSFSRNFGHSAAVFAGLDHATGDLVGIIDADLQDPPELLVNMISLLKEHKADVVYGQRSKREGESVFKKVSAWVFYRLLRMLSGVSLPTDTGDFRIMTREVCQALAGLKENEPFLRGLVAWVGFKQIPLMYQRQARQYGETKYPLKKMLKFAQHAIISFSDLPLRVAIYFGLFGVFASVLLTLYALYCYIYETTVPGWASTIIGFSYGHSITLLVVGIVGAYIGRIHSSLQNRPRYLLKKMEPKNEALYRSAL